MASLPIKPLDGESGYPRWKESILLRLRTLRLSYVLSDSPPPDPNSPEGKKWAYDDALCRGHILYTLSDRLFEIFSGHATAKAVWLALENTYVLDRSWSYLSNMELFKLDKSKPILEELARFDSIAALASANSSTKLDVSYACGNLIRQLPPEYALQVLKYEPKIQRSLSAVWEAVRRFLVFERGSQESEELQGGDEQVEEGISDRSYEKRRRVVCFTCGQEGHVARFCRAQ